MNDMTAAPAFSAADYKSDYKPIWCPGCGDFGVMIALFGKDRDVGHARTRRTGTMRDGCSVEHDRTIAFHGGLDRGIRVDTDLDRRDAVVER